MKLIVGLGNPGKKYEDTRHNVGFIAVAKIAALLSASPSKVKFEGELAEASASGTKVCLLCPHTYMNASGQSVRKAVDFYKLEHDDILVLCDDLNLAPGRLRIRPRGSAGGQNGLKDIIRHLGDESFPRLRIGIGRPPDGWTVTDYVLGKFAKNEIETIESATTQAAYAAISWVNDGIGAAMNKFNASADTDEKKVNTKNKPVADKPSAAKPRIDAETGEQSPGPKNES
ncbi:aminoacyl-tRNA hydrolase [Stieleria varia]|uniref:Peptidyl-tRNA hydrolase n=1 Tax=Stieleria varia TaxID=2528005 RepID=A0A5C6B0L3_9BACT|nr:aminoacyl-tRNA hydrolase [Stieleria varia]TWU05111.1 Peptidyl-tRNA hydrolase [Stieleria varia]